MPIGADDRRVATQILSNVLDEALERYPELRAWMTANAKTGPFGLVIIKPQNVRDEFHRIVHDRQLRERARPWIMGLKDYVCVPDDNGVLVIAPLY